MVCLQIYRESLTLATFHRVHSNSKELSYLSWQNKYPNLKTINHIRPNFFLWTKLPKNLLLTKYLLSVEATLILGANLANILKKLSYLTCSCTFHIILRNYHFPSKSHDRIALTEERKITEHIASRYAKKLVVWYYHFPFQI